MTGTAYFDINILIDFFAGHPPARGVMEGFPNRRISALTYIEFMAGLATPQQRARADEGIHALFEVVQTDLAICREAATLRGRTGMKLPDAIIYATARTGGGVLVTRDQDFDRRQPDVHVPYTL